jgi:hypothetical protein
MRRPISRRRKRTVTGDLVELFRKALPAEMVRRTEIVTGRRMTAEKHSDALAAIHAFLRASG